jgi:quercetin dioxygenase-like cupin family protein
MAVIEQEVKHRRPHPHSLSGSFIEMDLVREIEELEREPEWETGQNAKTLVKFDDYRVVLTVLKARRKVPPHSTDGRVSVQVVKGHALLRAEGRTFDLRPGRIVTFDRGILHEVEAIDESAILQTIAWPRN